MNRLLILTFFILAHFTHKIQLSGFENKYNLNKEERLSDDNGNAGGHGNSIVKESFHWNYQENGPDAWANKIEKCRGKKQSPINIDTNYVEYDMNLKPFLFLNYDLNLNWNLTHNGHTVQGRHIENEHISIRGSDLDDESFDLLQFHFHWGFNDFHGSEHLIDYTKYPLEMHLVHKSKTSGKYALLGILFKLAEEDNINLKNLLEGVNTARKSDKWQEITINLKKILTSLETHEKKSNYEASDQNDQLENLNEESDYKNISSLNSYYRYIGSLTTPPCTEGIIWTVFKNPINISSNQLQNFRLNELKLNFRDIQKIHNRKVFSSFPMLHTLYRNSPNQQQYLNSNKQSDIMCKMNNFKQNNSNKLNDSLIKIYFYMFISTWIILKL